MAQLSTIISSILRDMVVAQHEANMYAISLEDIYKKNGRLEKFSLPAIAMGEMELDLRYGVNNDSVQTEQYEINYPQLKKLTKEISVQLARIILGSALPVIQSSFAEDGTDDEKELVTRLAQIPVQRDFCTFLSRKILHSMQLGFTSLINTNGTINEKILLSCAVATGEEEILYHKELAGLFGHIGGEIVRSRVRETMQAAVEEALPKLVKDINLKRKRMLPSIEVTVNSDELSKLPDECIHTLHFKVSPRDIKFYMDDDQ